MLHKILREEYLLSLPEVTDPMVVTYDSPIELGNEMISLAHEELVNSSSYAEKQARSAYLLKEVQYWTWKMY